MGVCICVSPCISPYMAACKVTIVLSLIGLAKAVSCKGGFWS